MTPAREAIEAAHSALEVWDADDPDASVGEVFEAIYGRVYEPDEDTVGLIYAARLDAEEARRVLRILA